MTVWPARLSILQQATGLPIPLPKVCQFPLTSGKPWRFCCAPTVPDRPYCHAHVLVCYQLTPRSQAA